MPVVTVDLCSGKGKGLIVEWCLGEPLQDLPCSWSHQGQHSIVRGDVMDGDRGREVEAPGYFTPEAASCYLQ